MQSTLSGPCRFHNVGLPPSQRCTQRTNCTIIADLVALFVASIVLDMFAPTTFSIDLSVIWEYVYAFVVTQCSVVAALNVADEILGCESHAPYCREWNAVYAAGISARCVPIPAAILFGCIVYLLCPSWCLWFPGEDSSRPPQKRPRATHGSLISIGAKTTEITLLKVKCVSLESAPASLACEYRGESNDYATVDGKDAPDDILVKRRGGVKFTFVATYDDGSMQTADIIASCHNVLIRDSVPLLRAGFQHSKLKSSQSMRPIALKFHASNMASSMNLWSAHHWGLLRRIPLTARARRQQSVIFLCFQVPPGLRRHTSYWRMWKESNGCATEQAMAILTSNAKSQSTSAPKCKTNR